MMTAEPSPLEALRAKNPGLYRAITALFATPPEFGQIVIRFTSGKITDAIEERRHR